MDKKKKNGRKKLIITMAVALILLVGVTVSYGYIAILGNSKNQEVSVGTGDIHLVFDDADTESVNATLKLGESITKTFKIENKGTKPGKVQINWKNLINTYNSRSLSYTLESSNNKTSGYTKVEALRENVPVSTESKEVPLSKEITVPVQSTPIYYRVTITFNNLSDVDQSGDVNATLTTQFSLSEPENLSKKVIAVLNGNVKTSDPGLSTGFAPRPIYTSSYISDNPTSLPMNDKYIYYTNSYNLTAEGAFIFKDIQFAWYRDVYTILNGKYVLGMRDSEPSASEKEELLNSLKYSSNCMEVVSSSASNINIKFLNNIRTSEVDHSYDGIFASVDDYGTSYYYRGDIKNNYVKFANNYWKIIRVNGDGSIRMILAANDETGDNWKLKFINNGNDVAFNTTYDDIKYMGYMFGGSSESAASTSLADATNNKYSSNIKKEIDKWYENNLSSYTNYISDTLFCNDRTLARDDNVTKYFASYDRLSSIDTNKPTFKCSEKNDRFTVNDETIGNGDLTYPIGTITADELDFSGVQMRTALMLENVEPYLMNYEEMFTMTPLMMSNTNSVAIWRTSNSGSLPGTTNVFVGRVSPVINIKLEHALKMVGNGTIEDPFLVPGVN